MPHLVDKIDVLRALLCSAEKAAQIARHCRADNDLFQLLIEEKTDTANKRFKQDFKTLADVLIQETTRHDLSIKFPELSSHIYGEEDQSFTNTNGEHVQLRVCELEAATAELVTSVLDGNIKAANSLAHAVHSIVTVPEEAEFARVTGQVDIAQCGVWIDPIDGTNQYIKADNKPAVNGIYPSGLPNVTVLIGLFHLETGLPIIGVVNQPFSGQSGDVWVGRHVWGVYSQTTTDSVVSAGVRAMHQGRKELRVMMSESESAHAVSAAKTLKITPYAAGGAGYKLLAVIDGSADAYFLSKSSTYKWDTCGPHAIFLAAGGGVRNKGDDELKYNYPDDPNDHGSSKWGNKGGLLAATDPAIFDKFQSLW